jgi:hypothetical protein
MTTTGRPASQIAWFSRENQARQKKKHQKAGEQEGNPAVLVQNASKEMRVWPASSQLLI